MKEIEKKPEDIKYKDLQKELQPFFIFARKMSLKYGLDYLREYMEFNTVLDIFENYEQLVF